MLSAGSELELVGEAAVQQRVHEVVAGTLLGLAHRLLTQELAGGQADALLRHDHVLGEVVLPHGALRLDQRQDAVGLSGDDQGAGDDLDRCRVDLHGDHACSGPVVGLVEQKVRCQVVGQHLGYPLPEAGSTSLAGRRRAAGEQLAVAGKHEDGGVRQL